MKNYILIIISLITLNSCSQNSIVDYSNSSKSEIKKEIIESIYKKRSKYTEDQMESRTQFLNYIMSGIGIAELAIKQNTSKYNKDIEQCINGAMLPSSKFFDSIAWERDPILQLDTVHVGYIGYLNMLLSLYGTINKNSKYNSLNSKITQKLLTTLCHSETGCIETYIGQVYPTDNVIALASIATYYKAKGKSYPTTFVDTYKRFKKTSLDSKTGLMFYSVEQTEEELYTLIRGSASATGMYFMSFIDLEDSRRLYNSIIKELKTTVYFKTGIREYINTEGDDPMIDGDSNSGIIVYGVGSVATGFSIAGTKLFKDTKTFEEFDNLVKEMQPKIDMLDIESDTMKELQVSCLYAIYNVN